MTYKKYIITWTTPGVVLRSEAYIIAECYEHGLLFFQGMIRIAKKFFPDLKDKEIELRTVVYSSWCKGCPLIHFPVPAGSKRRGWTVLKGSPDVGW